MKRKAVKSYASHAGYTKQSRYAESEIGTVRKNWKGRLTIALVYPNSYHVGMSNLGFQTVYRLLNEIEHVVCERAFLPEDNSPARGRILTIESERPISDFDIVAFSLSFENDYPNVLTILQKAGIPLTSNDREDPLPLVIAGGVACFLNPEPLAPFIDCFLIGEAEALLPRFLNFYSSDLTREACLKTLARNVPGAYVPAFYRATYTAEGTLDSFEPICDVPVKIGRMFVENLSDVPTFSCILTPDTVFDSTFLIEMARGCPHGCRFCSAGYIYRPPRFRPLSLLEQCLQEGGKLTDKIGLVGATILDLPNIKELCDQAIKKNNSISFSSLRADSLSPEIVTILRQSNVKTATVAPDAGSERLRNVINKGITRDDIFNAVETLVAGGIPNIKLYFMIGLPTETIDDVEAVVELCKQIKQRFLASSRKTARMGTITISLNPFVPKPSTPFQWAAMDDVPTLKKKIGQVRNGLRKMANVRVIAESPRLTYMQALFSRGDRRSAQILSFIQKTPGNRTRVLKESVVNPDFYALRERPLDELLPWDFIDHGIHKSFLKREYERAKEGKKTLPCDVKSCTLCGVCEKKRPYGINTPAP